MVRGRIITDGLVRRMVNRTWLVKVGLTGARIITVRPY